MVFDENANTTLQTQNLNKAESRKYMHAKKYLEVGSQNITDKKFLLAISNYKKGLEELGYCYLSKNVMDDTGNWITIASMEEDAERFSNAASILQKVLTTRIILYEKNKTEKC